MRKTNVRADYRVSSDVLAFNGVQFRKGGECIVNGLTGIGDTPIEFRGNVVIEGAEDTFTNITANSLTFAGSGQSTLTSDTSETFATTLSGFTVPSLPIEFTLRKRGRVVTLNIPAVQMGCSGNVPAVTETALPVRYRPLIFQVVQLMMTAINNTRLSSQTMTISTGGIMTFTFVATATTKGWLPTQLSWVV